MDEQVTVAVSGSGPHDSGDDSALGFAAGVAAAVAAQASEESQEATQRAEIAEARAEAAVEEAIEARDVAAEARADAWDARAAYDTLAAGLAELREMLTPPEPVDDGAPEVVESTTETTETTETKGDVKPTARTWGSSLWFGSR